METTKLKKFVELKKFDLVESLKSRLIYEAFDEYVASFVAVDLAAASEHVAEINKLQLKVPEKLLRGEYDHYDTINKAHYFAHETLDCKLMASTKARLTNYLANVKTLLSVLREKLFYEYMSEKYTPLVELLHAQKLYESLADVNCRRRKI